MEDHVGLDKSHRLLEVRSGLERKAIMSMIVQKSKAAIGATTKTPMRSLITIRWKLQNKWIMGKAYDSRICLLLKKLWECLREIESFKQLHNMFHHINSFWRQKYGFGDCCMSCRHTQNSATWNFIAVKACGWRDCRTAGEVFKRPLVPRNFA